MGSEEISEPPQNIIHLTENTASGYDLGLEVPRSTKHLKSPLPKRAMIPIGL
jgi:hypothetical protein